MRFSAPRHSRQRLAFATGIVGAAAGLALLVGLAAPAAAVDRISVRAPEAGDNLRDALRGASLLLEARRNEVDDPQELLAAAKAEYGRMVEVLYAAGFYSGVVNVRIDGREAADFSPLEIPGAIREIEVLVEPGPPFAFSRAEATPLARGTELPEGFAVGERARSTLIRDAAGAAVGGWRARGHARAQPTGSRIVADHRQAQLDAQITIEPGPQLRFGQFIVEGNQRTRTQRIRTIAGLPEGEVFDPEALEASAQRLRRTGTFASVALSEAEEDGPGGTIDITATVIEAPRRRLGFGAEIDTQDGLRLSAFWLHRNLLRGAERLRVEGEIGGIGSSISGRDYRVAVRYGRPATLTPDTTLTFGLTAETVSERDYDARRFGVEAGLAHIFSDRLTGELAIGYLYERATDSQGTTTRTVLTLPGALRFDRRDDETDATRGFYVEGRATPFVGITGAGTGAQLGLDARAYRRVTDRVVLAARGQLGTVVGASIDETPRALLFTSGGSGTVRGQPFQSLAVDAPCPGGPPGCTVRTGGRGFAGISGEVRTDVTDTIGVVGFVDAGMVSASSFLSGGEWHSGAGLGLRYRTGIGPIRVDLGAPVSGSTRDGLQLYIGIGQAF